MVVFICTRAGAINHPERFDTTFKFLSLVDIEVEIRGGIARSA